MSNWAYNPTVKSCRLDGLTLEKVGKTNNSTCGPFGVHFFFSTHPSFPDLSHKDPQLLDTPMILQHDDMSPFLIPTIRYSQKLYIYIYIVNGTSNGVNPMIKPTRMEVYYWVYPNDWDCVYYNPQSWFSGMVYGLMALCLPHFTTLICENHNDSLIN